MGMAAEIFAIGLFQPEIVDCLGYPADKYQNTKPGTRIVVHIIEVDGTGQSRLLADCLGIDPWDFNQHELDISRINWERLEQEFYAETVEQMQALQRAGFVFFFRPNG